LLGKCLIDGGGNQTEKKAKEQVLHGLSDLRLGRVSAARVFTMPNLAGSRSQKTPFRSEFPAFGAGAAANQILRPATAFLN
jgi:hypothetical protein